jgi:hypothetical protein
MTTDSEKNKQENSAHTDNHRTQDVPRLHRQTLIEMNIAVFTARRDAAHERVLDVLRREMLTQEKEIREKLYSFCVILLDEAIMCTQRSQLDPDSPVMHYLCLLKDTLAATEALVRHERKISRESEDLSDVLNQYVMTQLKTANDVFSASEMNILDCVEDLIKFGEPLLTKDSQERLERLPEDDARRYNLALREYSAYYRRFNSNSDEKDLPRSVV